jgi:hypothetical protein
MAKIQTELLKARAARLARDGNWEMLCDWLWKQERCRPSAAPAAAQT